MNISILYRKYKTLLEELSILTGEAELIQENLDTTIMALLIHDSVAYNTFLEIVKDLEKRKYAHTHYTES